MFQIVLVHFNELILYPIFTFEVVTHMHAYQDWLRRGHYIYNKLCSALIATRGARRSHEGVSSARPFERVPCHFLARDVTAELPCLVRTRAQWGNLVIMCARACIAMVGSRQTLRLPTRHVGE